METKGIAFISSYDWEFVPAVLARIDWSALALENQYNQGKYRPNISQILREIIAAHPTDFDLEPNYNSWLGKARYAANKLYRYEYMLTEHDDWFRRAFESGEDPRAAVERFGEKYELIRADRW